jgi:hypothetical protein
MHCLLPVKYSIAAVKPESTNTIHGSEKTTDLKKHQATLQIETPDENPPEKLHSASHSSTPNRGIILQAF